MNKWTYLPGIALTFLATTVVQHAQDREAWNKNWPQWRGPTGNGVALHGAPPIHWSEQQNVKWKVPIPGLGHATPIVWNNKIFVLTAVSSASPQDNQENQDGDNRRGRRGFGRRSAPTEEYEFLTLCLDRDSGNILWRKVARKEVPHQGRHPTNSYSSGSPITDGEHLFAFFGSRGLYCYDMEGNLIWDKDFGEIDSKMGFGEATTPALHGNTLVVVWDTEKESFICALNKSTGKQLWKTTRDEDTGWSTPYILEYNGQLQVVVNASNATRGYNLETGEALWSCPGQTANAIPSVVADENTVYAMSGFRANTAVAIELGHRGNLENTDAIRWKFNRDTPYVPSPLLYDGLLYFTKANSNPLTCLDAKTGESVYEQPQRLPDMDSVYASPVGANNYIYFVGREGTSVVIPKEKEFKVAAINKLDDSFDASPVVVGNQLFLRGHDYLYCITEN